MFGEAIGLITLQVLNMVLRVTFTFGCVQALALRALSWLLNTVFPYYRGLSSSVPCSCAVFVCSLISDPIVHVHVAERNGKVTNGLSGGHRKSPNRTGLLPGTAISMSALCLVSKTHIHDP